MLSRRSLLAALAAARSGTLLADEAPAPTLRFPRDFGAHPESRSEWWYITGALDAGEQKTWGFQITCKLRQKELGNKRGGTRR